MNTSMFITKKKIELVISWPKFKPAPLNKSSSNCYTVVFDNRAFQVSFMPTKTLCYWQHKDTLHSKHETACWKMLHAKSTQYLHDTPKSTGSTV